MGPLWLLNLKAILPAATQSKVFGEYANLKKDQHHLKHALAIKISPVISADPRFLEAPSRTEQSFNAHSSTM